MQETTPNVLLLAGPQFEDRELFYPLLRFKEAGAFVTIAGLGEPSYTGKAGLTLPVDGIIDDLADAKAWDAVIIPGGWAPDKIRMNPYALKVVKDTLSRGAVVGAICHGGWVLASAKVLTGRTVTSYIAIKDDMEHAGAIWVDKAVVRDGGLVTSRTPDDLPLFCQEILGIISRTVAMV
jgi:protease I